MRCELEGRGELSVLLAKSPGEYCRVEFFKLEVTKSGDLESTTVAVFEKGELKLR